MEQNWCRSCSCSFPACAVWGFVSFKLQCLFSMSASNAECVHAVTGGGGADSMSQVVEGGSGHYICQVRGAEMVSDSGEILA